MAETFTISTTPLDAAFDYQALREIGIESLENTTSEIWTDYNAHDPGITMLEILCYAVTELSYKANLSIPEYLAPKKPGSSDGFASALEILPNYPLTIKDYRKLIIDVVGVKNAWLQKRTKPLFADITNKKLVVAQPQQGLWQAVDVKAYYDVLLEFDTNVASDDDKKNIRKTVKQILMKKRNLCEDFVSFAQVSQQKYRLCAELELSSGADTFDVLAQLFFNVQIFLTPLIKFYPLKDLLAQGLTPAEIFNGPVLQHGFIKDEELDNTELPTAIYLSDLMREMMKLPELQDIREIIFNPVEQTDALPNKWIIDNPDSRQPVLDILTSNILVYKNGMPFRPDMQQVQLKFQVLMNDYIKGNDKVITENLPYDTAVFTDLAAYYSIQNHFPKTYGISAWGLSPEVPNKRRVQAYQLKAYLYFFEQVIKNFLSQAAHVRNLFSLSDIKTTYYTEVANSFKDADKIFVDATTIAGKIQAAAETPQQFIKRRNLFIDHLISRYAESFFDYADALKSAFKNVKEEDVLQTKISFSKNYPQYSSQRTDACNYTDKDNIWNTDNTSGLEKRLQHLLGFANTKRRSLANVIAVIQQGVDEANNTVFWFEITSTKDARVLLKGNQKQADKAAAQKNLRLALLYANNSKNYTVAEDAETHKSSYTLLDADKKVIADSDVQFDKTDDAQQAVIALTKLLTTGQSEEGMFVIEHFLLLPDLSDANIDDAFLKICVDDNCSDCEDKDPYSFRISFVLPAYANRFLNMDFRRYCERIIRMETPSHILPKICWVNNEQLHDFELAYQDWLKVKAGITKDDDNSILKKFITVFSTLKTVYPVSTIEDCSSKEEKNLFILNKNALGTIKS